MKCKLVSTNPRKQQVLGDWDPHLHIWLCSLFSAETKPISTVFACNPSNNERNVPCGWRSHSECFHIFPPTRLVQVSASVVIFITCGAYQWAGDLLENSPKTSSHTDCVLTPFSFSASHWYRPVSWIRTAAMCNVALRAWVKFSVRMREELSTFAGCCGYQTAPCQRPKISRD